MSRIEDIRVEKKEWDNLKTALGEHPPVKQIDKNKYAGGSLYVPIGYIQAKLDQIFLTWDWTIDKQEFVAGNCVVTGTLICHTMSGKMIKRSGIGVSEVKVEPNGLVVKKAMEKGYPKSDAQALKNASQKLGNIFGRNLNRKFKWGHIEGTDLVDKIFGDE